MKRKVGNWVGGAVAFAGWLLSGAAPAVAHPHVWVVVEATILFDKGSISGIRHKWTFDDMYTAMAIQGLDANKDGVYDRKELDELAKVNMEGLKEFEYFTYVKLGVQRLKTKPPADYYLEHAKDGLLSLFFTVPFAQPVLADAQDFGFQVTDPGYFIAFEFAKQEPIKLAEGAPAGCKPSLSAAEKEAAEAQKLGESFFAQMGGNFGVTVAQTASVVCKP